MVRDEEAFLPSHEDDSLSLAVAFADGQVRAPEFGLEVTEGRESTPVGHILVLRRRVVIGSVSSEEPESFSHDLGVKVGREFRVIVGQAFDTEVAAQCGCREVDVLISELN